MFSPGLNAEDRLQTLLERFGCNLIEGPKLDHEHKLDFVVSSFPQVPRLFHLGVQVTTRLDDRDKQALFLKVSRENPAVDKNLYVELEAGLNLEKGGGFLVMMALAEFMHNKLHVGEGIRGLRITSDLKYYFYDLAQAILSPPGLAGRPAEGLVNAPFPVPARPRPVAAPHSNPVPAIPAPARVLMAGRLTRYNIERSIGLLVSQEGSEYFVHKTNFMDLTLRLEVEASASINEWLIEPIPVQFYDGGRLEGKKNNIAQAIRRRVPNSVLTEAVNE